MNSVWKYVVPYPGQQARATIEVVPGARLLSCACDDDDQVVVYALVDPLRRDQQEWRYLIVANTGTQLDSTQLDRAAWIGTCRTSNGIVWHVWEVPA